MENIQPQAEQATPPEQKKAVEGEQKMSPQEQEQYEMVVINGMQIVHSEKFTNMLLARMSNTDNPVKEIATVTVDVVNRLNESAMENQQQLSPSVLAHGGNAVMGEILAVLEAAGMEQLSEEQKNAAFEMASATFVDQASKSGLMPPEQLQQLGQAAQQTPEGQAVMQKLNSQQKPGILQQGVQNAQ